VLAPKDFGAFFDIISRKCFDSLKPVTNVYHDLLVSSEDGA
jgi:hypothetical protein